MYYDNVPPSEASHPACRATIFVRGIIFLQTALDASSRMSVFPSALSAHLLPAFVWTAIQLRRQTHKVKFSYFVLPTSARSYRSSRGRGSSKSRLLCCPVTALYVRISFRALPAVDGVDAGILRRWADIFHVAILAAATYGTSSALQPR